MNNKTTLVLIFSGILILSCFIAQSSAFFDKHAKLFLGHYHKEKKAIMSNTNKSVFSASELVFDMANTLYSQKGQTKENDKITNLPGQPPVKFDQYGGYVVVDEQAGRALYYYFAEADHPSPNALPLLLWLNGGPGCSSLGYGAMHELGPFRVKSDGKTLFLNEYSWNKVANVLFLESPAGVGFSYSNTTADILSGGDKKTAEDNYVFLLNWLERFPEYKTREFYIAGESYVGHYVPQLAQTILHQNDNVKQANNNINVIINLKGIIIGNALINDDNNDEGQWDFFVIHALISEDLKNQAYKYCTNNLTDDQCNKTMTEADAAVADIDLYNIYAPKCLNNLTDTMPKETSILDPDPCSVNYVTVYLNGVDVQKALHANVTNIYYSWTPCSNVLLNNWTDRPDNVIPLLKEIMSKYRLPVWIFSGDTDGIVPVTSTQLSIKEMKIATKTLWRPWYLNVQEVGGYTQEYEGGLTFATVRGVGHEVPAYQPDRALTLIRSFLAGKMLTRKHTT